MVVPEIMTVVVEVVVVGTVRQARSILRDGTGGSGRAGGCRLSNDEDEEAV